MSGIPNYYILRLNHRRERDKRLTTHVGLIARAFNARGFIYTGEADKKLEQSLIEVSNEWGGLFEIHYWNDWIANCNLIRSAKAVIVHLTMYGDPLPKFQKIIHDQFFLNRNNIIFVVGGPKVPPEIYQIANYNISVTSQPHSEVSALAVAIDRIFPEAINTQFSSHLHDVKAKDSLKLID